MRTSGSSNSKTLSGLPDPNGETHSVLCPITSITREFSRRGFGLQTLRVGRFSFQRGQLDESVLRFGCRKNCSIYSTEPEQFLRVGSQTFGTTLHRICLNWADSASDCSCVRMGHARGKGVSRSIRGGVWGLKLSAPPLCSPRLCGEYIRTKLFTAEARGR